MFDQGLGFKESLSMASSIRYETDSLPDSPFLEGEARSRQTAEFDIERLRSFLEFSLACKYGLATNAVLTSEDYQHFANLRTCLMDIHRSFMRLRTKTSQDNNQIWKRLSNENDVMWTTIHQHIGGPCHALGIPTRLARKAIYSFFCEDGILNLAGEILEYGSEVVATVIWDDINIILPAVVFDSLFRRLALEDINERAAEYFVNIRAPDGQIHTRWETNRPTIVWSTSEVLFDLTDSGRTYDKRHRANQSSWPVRQALSLRQQGRKLKIAVAHLVERARQTGNRKILELEDRPRPRASRPPTTASSGANAGAIAAVTASFVACM